MTRSGYALASPDAASPYYTSEIESSACMSGGRRKWEDALNYAATNERRFAEDGVVKLGYCSTMNAQPPSSRGSLIPMPHVPEIGADTPENWYHINRQNMPYSLPEADTRKIRYQIACQTRQQLVPVFWYRFRRRFLVSLSWALHATSVFGLRRWLKYTRGRCTSLYGSTQTLSCVLLSLVSVSVLCFFLWILVVWIKLTDWSIDCLIDWLAALRNSTSWNPWSIHLFTIYSSTAEKKYNKNWTT